MANTANRFRWLVITALLSSGLAFSPRGALGQVAPPTPINAVNLTPGMA